MPKNTPQRAIDSAYSTIAARAAAATAGGTVTPVTDHGALSGLGDDDHPQYVLAASANYVDLTDGGGTTLHTHDHGALAGLTDDDHAGYLLATGARAGATAQPQLFTSGVQANWLDKPLVTPANGSHFDDYTATYPAGWTEVDSPLTTNTNNVRGFWFLYGQGANFWKYRRQVGGMTTGSNSFVFGPIMWRLAAFAANITYLFGLYRDNAGVIDDTTFIRTNLTYDSALAAWKVRAERKDGTTQTNGSWLQLASPLPIMPIWTRVGVTTSSTNVRAYVGTTPFGLTHYQLMTASQTTAWGTSPWLQVELADRSAASIDDYLYIGGHDRGSDA